VGEYPWGPPVAVLLIGESPVSAPGHGSGRWSGVSALGRGAARNAGLVSASLAMDDLIANGRAASRYARCGYGRAMAAGRRVSRGGSAHQVATMPAVSWL